MDNPIDWSKGARILCRLEGHIGEINAVLFSPDSCYVYTASSDHTVKKWSIDGTMWETLGTPADYERKVYSPDDHWGEHPCGHWFSVDAIAISPDGMYILTGGGDADIILWDASDGREVAALKGHRNDVTLLLYSLDG